MKSLLNVTKLEWAQQCASSTYPDLRHDQREAISIAVSTYLKHPYALDDEGEFDAFSYFVDLLLPTFPRKKAELIATTEISRAFAHLSQVQGEKMKYEYTAIKEIQLNIQVLKIWNTRSDKDVCPLCRNLEGKEVDITDTFTESIFIPPAHEGCRCWIISTNYSMAGLKKSSYLPPF